jgi:CubicO group peptidase (beta-lactamase class C family)
LIYIKCALLFLLIFSAIFCLAYADNEYYPADSWRTSTPEAQGMDSDILYQVIDVIQSSDYNINSLLVIRHGYLVEEAYFYPYRRNDLRDIQSCTKSFVSALTGIAIQKGFIGSINQKVVDFFPDVEITNLDERKKNITVENLLTMSSGLGFPEWDYRLNATNDYYLSMYSGDLIKNILNSPMRKEPGKAWKYNNSDAHLLSAIIRRVYKMDEKGFIETFLFNPLGISNYIWRKDQQENYFGALGLTLKPQDMAKFGYLYLKKGKWKGDQIIPEYWINTSSRMHFDFRPYKAPNARDDEQTSGYGYQFYTMNFGGYCAAGYEGQYIYILPDQDMVVVFTSHLNTFVDSPMINYFVPTTLTKEIIVHAIKSETALPEKPISYSNHLLLLKQLENDIPNKYKSHTNI